MKELCEYLLQHLILDFDGEVNYDTITRFLGDDPDPDARSLRARLIADSGAEDFLIVLSDCLRDAVQSGIDADEIANQIRIYAES